MKLRSEYLSEAFKTQLWPCFEAEFCGERAHSLKNYKNTLEPFCAYVKKDFLGVTEADIDAYYAYLEERVENGTMSRRTMLTYKKNLRALSCAVERYICEKQLPIVYQNHFRNSIQGDVRTISEDVWLANSEDVSRLIAQAHSPKEMLILLVLTEGALTAAQISTLIWEGFMEERRWYGYDEQHGFPVSELFLIAWKDYREEVEAAGGETTGILFRNRNGNPINTKGISSLIKRCRTEAGISAEITARQLRDYALMQKLLKLLSAGEAADEQAASMDEAQITRMRELYLHFPQIDELQKAE